MGRARDQLPGLALVEPGGPRGEGSGLAGEVVWAAGGLGLSGKGVVALGLVFLLMGWVALGFGFPNFFSYFYFLHY